MMKRIAIVFGVVFILAGVLGFVPAVAPMSATTGHPMLFGAFAVDGVHNWVHILSGIIALIVAYYGALASRTYFKVFGIIYALVAVWGIFMGRENLLGDFMANNAADVVLHAAIAIVALFLGFAPRFEAEVHHPGDTGHHPA